MMAASVNCSHPLVLVRVRLVSPDGQDGVQEQDPLLRPRDEVAVVGDRATHVGLQFAEHVDQTRRRLDPGLDRKAKPVRLARAVIGVLTEQEHLDPIKRGQFERVENIGFGVGRPDARLARWRRILGACGSRAWSTHQPGRPARTRATARDSSVNLSSGRAGDHHLAPTPRRTQSTTARIGCPCRIWRLSR